MTVTFGEPERGKPARYDLEDCGCAEVVELQGKLDVALAALRTVAMNVQLSHELRTVVWAALEETE